MFVFHKSVSVQHLLSKPCLTYATDISIYKTLLFPEFCTFEFMLHIGKPTMNWFIPGRSMRPMFHLSSIHQSAIKPESELTRKYCKMALKYSFKLVFLKCIFEFMIIELHKLQTVCMAEESANLTVIILPI